MVGLPQFAKHWHTIGSVAGGAIMLAGGLMFARMRRRPSAQELEGRRRRHLATHGRIVDGSLIEAEPSEGEPRAVIYRYRIAGVTYECSQDVSELTTMVKNLRVDYPVQVRYNPANPADSIVVAEDWNGLWTNLWIASNAGAAPHARQTPGLTQGLH